MATNEEYHILRNLVIDMQGAIIGWRKKVSFDSESDLIDELERMIEVALDEKTIDSIRKAVLND